MGNGREPIPVERDPTCDRRRCITTEWVTEQTYNYARQVSAVVSGKVCGDENKHTLSFYRIYKDLEGSQPLKLLGPRLSNEYLGVIIDKRQQHWSLYSRCFSQFASIFIKKGSDVVGTR
jgi:hypothetical protein